MFCAIIGLFLLFSCCELVFWCFELFCVYFLVILLFCLFVLVGAFCFLHLLDFV